MENRLLTRVPVGRGVSASPLGDQHAGNLQFVKSAFCVIRAWRVHIRSRLRRNRFIRVLRIFQIRLRANIGTWWRWVALFRHLWRVVRLFNSYRHL